MFAVKSFPHYATACGNKQKRFTFVLNKQSMSEQKTLGAVLKGLREAKSLSLRTVEVKTDISNAYLSQLENDKARKPSANILYKLAELYQADFQSLMSLAGIVQDATAMNKSLGEYVFSKDNLTPEEENELIQYLKFIRARKG
jgi:transcriptional regulator with XRE-family HTH domain